MEQPSRWLSKHFACGHRWFPYSDCSRRGQIQTKSEPPRSRSPQCPCCPGLWQFRSAGIGFLDGATRWMVRSFRWSPASIQFTEGALTMRKCLLVLGVLILGSMLHAAPPDAPSGWRAKVAETMPLLGHRNWILIVDSALSSSGLRRNRDDRNQRIAIAGYSLRACSHRPLHPRSSPHLHGRGTALRS